jgi:hypothetical protein
MGAATAREMARRGFHVLAGVRRDSDGKALRAAGIEPVILDVTNREHIAALVARIDGDPRHRAVRVLINNAGLPCAGPVEVVPLDEWRRVCGWGEASPPGPNARPHVMLRVCSDVSSERGRTGRPGSTGTWLPA